MPKETAFRVPERDSSASEELWHQIARARVAGRAFQVNFLFTWTSQAVYSILTASFPGEANPSVLRCREGKPSRVLCCAPTMYPFAAAVVFRVARLLTCRPIFIYRQVRLHPTDLVAVSSKRCEANSQVQKAQSCNCLLMILWGFAAASCKSH